MLNLENALAAVDERFTAFTQQLGSGFQEVRVQVLGLDDRVRAMEHVHQMFGQIVCMVQVLDNKLTEGQRQTEKEIMAREARMSEALQLLATQGQGQNTAASSWPAPHNSDPRANVGPPGMTSTTGAQWLPPSSSLNQYKSKENNLKSKDFAAVERFNGDLDVVLDWADRMVSNIMRTHHDMIDMLKWAEPQLTHITQVSESNYLAGGATSFSLKLYDVLTDRTGLGVRDKRRNAGLGRGLELWRVPKRDTHSSELNTLSCRST